MRFFVSYQAVPPQSKTKKKKIHRINQGWQRAKNSYPRTCTTAEYTRPHRLHPVSLVGACCCLTWQQLQKKLGKAKNTRVPFFFQIVIQSLMGGIAITMRFFIARSPGASATFLAEISVNSPWKLVIFIIWKNLFWIKVSKKTFYLILKIEALPGALDDASIKAAALSRGSTTTCTNNASFFGYPPCKRWWSCPIPSAPPHCFVNCTTAYMCCASMPSNRQTPLLSTA